MPQREIIVSRQIQPRVICQPDEQQVVVRCTPDRKDRHRCAIKAELQQDTTAGKDSFSLPHRPSAGISTI